MVQRYFHNQDGVSLDPRENGEWVKYDDYAKLANYFLFVAFGVKDAEENPVDDDTYNAACAFIDESKNN